MKLGLVARLTAMLTDCVGSALVGVVLVMIFGACGGGTTESAVSESLKETPKNDYSFGTKYNTNVGAILMAIKKSKGCGTDIVVI